MAEINNKRLKALNTKIENLQSKLTSANEELKSKTDVKDINHFKEFVIGGIKHLLYQAQKEYNQEKVDYFEKLLHDTPENLHELWINRENSDNKVLDAYHEWLDINDSISNLREELKELTDTKEVIEVNYPILKTHEGFTQKYPLITITEKELENDSENSDEESSNEEYSGYIIKENEERYFKDASTGELRKLVKQDGGKSAQRKSSKQKTKRKTCRLTHRRRKKTKHRQN
jgi:hypothetical protein